MSTSRHQARPHSRTSEVPVPDDWYNIVADLDFELPAEVRHDSNREVRSVNTNVPKALVRQNLGLQRSVPIPEPIKAAFAWSRPTPLMRAVNLERALDTPARIYYKFEGSNLAGTHKLITAMAQAYYYKKAGINRIISMTAAGQWGTAISVAAQRFGLDRRIYMMRSSHENKPARRTIMELVGTEVVPSPSEQTQAGREALKADPAHQGSMALAITEGLEDASNEDGSSFIIGGSENYAILHTTVVGKEAVAQCKAIDEWPDTVIAYLGGGKNFGGLAFPFLSETWNNGAPPVRCLAVESAAYPCLTRGVYRYDYTDFSGLTPLAKMYTLGHAFVGHPILAAGMRYHAAPKLVSALYSRGLVDAVALKEREVFEAASLFIKAEGIVPSPEAAYAVKAAVDAAVEAREAGESKAIVFCISDHGHYDFHAYNSYLNGEVRDHVLTEEELQTSQSSIPEVKS